MTVEIIQAIGDYIVYPICMVIGICAFLFYLYKLLTCGDGK